MRYQKYKCPCCGYETNNKAYMKKHLYTLKKPCPKLVNDIHLTNEIKDYILANRTWKSKIQPPPPTTIQIINTLNQQNNCINYYIANLDPIEKLNKFISYKESDIIPIEDRIENKYGNIISKLENDKFKYGFELDREALLNIVDDISLVISENSEDMNIIHDEEGKKLKLYDGEWKSLRYKCAVKELLQAIKGNYLDTYEFYLIKKILNSKDNLHNFQRLNELLGNYYNFLSCNDLYPYVQEINDEDELDFDDKDKFYSKYIKIYDAITNAEKNKTQKEVLDIIVRNSKQNIADLNKKIIALFKMDEDFKKVIIEESL